MQCIKCLNVYNDSKSYLQHLQEQHELRGSGRYVCTLCNEVLNKFYKYTKHIEICFKKNHHQNEAEQFRQDAFLEAYNDCEMEDINLTAFKDTVTKSALKLVSWMSANMILPRSLVFEQISQFQTFMDTIVDGLNSVALPRVQPQEKKTMKDFIESVASSLDTVKTEYRLLDQLNKAGVISNFEKCALSDDEKDETGNILMPLSFQIKKFFEIPEVFEKIRKNTEALQSQNKLNNFINGSLWKEKLESYKEDDFVIPFHIYADGAQLNHPLGPHCSNGAETLNYYSFPTIPTQYQSRLENIFVAALFPEKYLKTYTLEEIYGNVVDEYKKLAHEGIVLNINGVEQHIYLVCGLFLGDNKESNAVLSFMRGPNANYYCRYCRLHRENMQTATRENPEDRRNRENYEEDVLLHDRTQTGIREHSIFNYIPHFHVTESSAEDITHNVEEGICHYHVMEILYHFIYDEKYFTLEELNQRMLSFDYDHDEKANVPHSIAKEQFKKRKFSMTASEMSNFMQNITFIIGDLIPEEDVVWHFLLATVKFFDTCYLPSYDDQEIEEWRDLIDYMLRSYQDLFDLTLKPVQHMAIHYPTDTKRYGPLRYARTIRFEGKHKELKGYSNNTNNRMNISYSLGKKILFSYANRLLESKGLEDVMDARYDTGIANTKVYWSKLEASQYKNQLEQAECFFSEKVQVNGILFAFGLWLPDFVEHKIREIVDIITVAPKNIQNVFAVCRTYTNFGESEHFASYSVDESSLQDEFCLINIDNFLTHHQYPVKVHRIGRQCLFRCKRF